MQFIKIYLSLVASALWGISASALFMVWIGHTIPESGVSPMAGIYYIVIPFLAAAIASNIIFRKFFSEKLIMVALMIIPMIGIFIAVSWK